MLHPETLPLVRAFAEARVKVWLIGGQAIEVLCGGNVRDHDDLDFLVSHADGPRAVAVLENLGFTHAHGLLEAGDVFYKRGELLVDLVPVLEHPPRTLGELERIGWPAEFLEPYVVKLERTPVPTLTPAMHRRMKEIVAEFYGVEPRPKDLQDLAALILTVKNQAS